MDTFEAYVWEPSVVKINALTAATEAACLILSVDETVCWAQHAAQPSMTSCPMRQCLPLSRPAFQLSSAGSAWLATLAHCRSDHRSRAEYSTAPGS